MVSNADFLTLVQSSGPQNTVLRPSLRELSNGGYALCWCQISRTVGAACVRVFDNHFNQIGDDLVERVSGGCVSADITALSSGGFALAWSAERQIFVRFVDIEGVSGEAILVGKCAKQFPEIWIESLPSGEVGVSWEEFLVFLKPHGPLLLADTGAGVWHAALAKIGGHTLLRLTTGAEAPYTLPPIYEITGTYFDASARQQGSFVYKMPTSIVDDTYAHPQELSVASDQNKVVLVFTDIAGHNSNSIKGLHFANLAAPFGEPMIIASAISGTHVRAPSAIPVADNEFLVSWAIDADCGLRQMARRFSHRLMPIGAEFSLLAEPIDGCAWLTSDCAGIAALWLQGGAIRYKPIRTS